MSSETPAAPATPAKERTKADDLMDALLALIPSKEEAEEYERNAEIWEKGTEESNQHLLQYLTRKNLIFLQHVVKRALTYDPQNPALQLKAGQLLGQRTSAIARGIEVAEDRRRGSQASFLPAATEQQLAPANTPTSTPAWTPPSLADTLQTDAEVPQPQPKRHRSHRPSPSRKVRKPQRRKAPGRSKKTRS